MDDDYSYPSSPSVKYKFRHSFCFSCCFGRGHHRRHHLPSHSPPPPPPPLVADDNPALIWVRTKGPRDHSFREFKVKWRSFLGLSGTRHKRHSSSQDFRYDPLSYALNFEDGIDDDDAAPLKNFSARLPPSPPLTVAVN